MSMTNELFPFFFACVSFFNSSTDCHWMVSLLLLLLGDKRRSIVFKSYSLLLIIIIPVSQSTGIYSARILDDSSEWEWNGTESAPGLEWMSDPEG